MLDAAVNVIFGDSGLRKLNQNGQSFRMSMKEAGTFKISSALDNHHLEETSVWVFKQRAHCVKLGYCEERPKTMWKEIKEGDKTT